MKIRNGFVSNSSSSSFLIYGIACSRDEIRRAYIDPNKKDVVLTETSDDDENDEDDDDFNIYDLSIPGLEIHSTEDDMVFLGGCWSGVGDDETGKQFKERVEAAIREYLPTLADQCETHQGEYSC